MPVKEVPDMNINFREVNYIVTIAQEGTITKAAQKLYIAQPSLSQAVKKIEQETGVVLFTRVKNRLKLTPEGEAFVEAGIKINKIMRDRHSDRIGNHPCLYFKIPAGGTVHCGVLLQRAGADAHGRHHRHQRYPAAFQI